MTELEVRVADLTERVARREARCARLADLAAAGEGDGTDIVTTGDGGPQLSYIHADHLGRPAFVTDTDGAVVWDAGITTPFGVNVETQDMGDAVQTMAALTQPLMFPGQYRDEETGYDDNWHRTYDPALGRYLQSDPIGLAGGLNRYAYVGGNPVSYVDPTGLNSITFSDYLGVVGGEIRTKPIRGKNPFYVGGVAGGAALAAIYYNSAIYEDPVDAAADCPTEDAGDEAKERLITYPPRKRGNWHAVCRVDDQGLSPSRSGLKFARGYGVAKDMNTARKIAEKDAKNKLGSSNVHHPSCKCTGPKGQTNNCGR